MRKVIAVALALLNASLGGRFPCLDFAGGTVVHVTSGVSALVCAIYLGKRVGYPKVPMTPHSVVLQYKPANKRPVPARAALKPAGRQRQAIAAAR